LRDGNLVDYLDVEALKAGDSARMVGEQANPPQIQVRQDLRSDSYFALNFALVGWNGRQAALAMETKNCLVTQLLDREAL
jgi:hypothetical protein